MATRSVRSIPSMRPCSAPRSVERGRRPPAEQHPVGAPALQRVGVLVRKPDQGEDRERRQRKGKTADEVAKRRLGIILSTSTRVRLDESSARDASYDAPRTPSCCGRGCGRDSAGRNSTSSAGRGSPWRGSLAPRTEWKQRALRDRGGEEDGIGKNPLDVGEPRDDPHVELARVEDRRFPACRRLKRRVWVGEVVAPERIERACGGSGRRIESAHELGWTTDALDRRSDGH